ncbi:MAG: hypothetical protein HW389_3796 [Bacteroidetes bacterium]|nr:hypothetical protein [Bacteroidota bacterium]
MPQAITTKDLNTLILNNDNSGNAYGGPNLHPYRFVFLDGCKTAGGKLSDAFGIPSKRNMPTKQFTDQGMRFRTFLGWKSTQVAAFAQIPLIEHFNFVGGLCDKWAEPLQLPRTLQAAKDAAQAVAGPNNSRWSGADDLVIYGYKDLLWQDTNP